MNKERRKNLQQIYDSIEQAKSALEEVLSEEQDYRDNIPENMQSSERYEKAETACDEMDSAICNLEDVLSSIETAME